MRRVAGPRAKKRAILVTMLLAASSAVGAVGFGLSNTKRPETTLLSPLQFQLNGKDPYVIKVPMNQGETISGEVNATGGALTFTISLQGTQMQSESVSGSYRYQFTAPAKGVYDLTCTSAEPADVSIDVYSP